MSFLGLDLNARGLLTGFAADQLAQAKTFRSETMDSVKDTLNYRAQLAVKNKAEKEAELKANVQMGKALINMQANFDVSQIGVLAGNGQLENVYKLYMEAQQKGFDLPDADTVVTLSGEANPNVSLTDHLRNITIGSHVSEKSKADLGFIPPYKQKEGIAGLFDFKSAARRDAEEYASDFSSKLGLTPDDLTAYAFDGFTKEQPAGTVDISPFAGMDASRVDFDKALGAIGSRVSATLDLGTIYQLDSAGIQRYTPRANQSEREKFFQRVELGLQGEIKERLDTGETYQSIVTDVSKNLLSVEAIKNYFNELPKELKEGIDVEKAFEATVLGSLQSPMAVLDDDIRAKLEAVKTSKNFSADLIKILDEIDRKGNTTASKIIKDVLRNNRQGTPEKMIDAVLNLNVSTDQPETDQMVAQGSVEQSVSGKPLTAREPEEGVPSEDVLATTEILQQQNIDVANVVEVEDALMKLAEGTRAELVASEDISDDDYTNMLSIEIGPLAQEIARYAQSARGVA